MTGDPLDARLDRMEARHREAFRAIGFSLALRDLQTEIDALAVADEQFRALVQVARAARTLRDSVLLVRAGCDDGHLDFGLPELEAALSRLGEEAE